MPSADVPDTRAYLFSLEQIGIKLGLDQINALLGALGRPDETFRSIVVAGTNGKGSTTAMIERGLRAAGYRTGRYTSPHLVHIEERMAVDGVSIDPSTFDESAERVRRASDVLPAPPSFFEATTALALDVFRSLAVDVAVLEVGLGGRLDATNAVAARAAVITAVDFDHEAYLGHTLDAIAGEKAGVIKPGQVVVLAENPPQVDDVVSATCATKGATLLRAWADVSCRASVVDGLSRLDLETPARRYDPIALRLRGRHQISNAITAVRLLETIDSIGWLNVPTAAIRMALEDVSWPARLELITNDAGSVLIDGAHNPAGARTLAAYIDETFGQRLPIVLGVMADKNIDGIVQALEGSALHIFATAATSPRAATPADVAAAVARVAPGLPVSIEPIPSAAIRRAHAIGDLVVVAGSLYLAGEIRAGL